MNDSDAFFTHTIVGAPFSVVLGRRLGPRHTSTSGIEFHLGTGHHRLSEVWNDWLVSNPAFDVPGRPRRRPGRYRRILERHAFWLACFGLASLTGSALFWGLMA
ncbi:MAG: hypothetical protein ACK40L_13920 [Hydrogenophaga sp.]|jgi:hypothetical protein|nr:hypothetical protein [Hydrogenophaga sp.]